MCDNSAVRKMKVYDFNYGTSDSLGLDDSKAGTGGRTRGDFTSGAGEATDSLPFVPPL